MGTDELFDYLEKYDLELDARYDNLLHSESKKPWHRFVIADNRHIANDEVIDLIDRLLRFAIEYSQYCGIVLICLFFLFFFFVDTTINNVSQRRKLWHMHILHQYVQQKASNSSFSKQQVSSALFIPCLQACNTICLQQGIKRALTMYVYYNFGVHVFFK